jgi:hypothetical protein
MTQCDPLLVFDGRFVLVATYDGRIAIYSIFDFETPSGISEDVEASESRKQVEWMEEDADPSRAQQQQQQQQQTKNNQLGNSRADINASQHSQQSVQVEEEENVEEDD